MLRKVQYLLIVLVKQYFLLVMYKNKIDFVIKLIKVFSLNMFVELNWSSTTLLFISRKFIKTHIHCLHYVLNCLYKLFRTIMNEYFKWRGGSPVGKNIFDSRSK